MIKKIGWGFISAIQIFCIAQAADDEIELVSYMSSLQYFAHKAGLAVSHKNQKLAAFYAHEIEEVIEKVEKVKSYDGFPVGNLAKSILLPAFEDFEAKLKAEDWKNASTAFDKVIDACNSCHRATEHGFIKINRGYDNPYIQFFE